MFRFFRRAKENEHPEYIEDYRTQAEVIAITKRLGSISTTLSPCPFCGGSASEITDLLNSEYSKFFAHIECEQCGVRTRQVEITATSDPMEELRRIWESRVLPENTIANNSINLLPDVAPWTNVPEPNCDHEPWVNVSDRCSYCSMPGSWMPDCAATGNCQRLNDVARKDHR